MEPAPSTSTARAKRVWFVLLAMLGITAIVGGFAAWFFRPTGPETTLTHATFKTDAERRSYVNQFLPLDVPAEATGIAFVLTSWMDFSLDGEFFLPPDAFNVYMEQLKARTTGNSIVRTFTTEKSTGTLTLDPQRTRIVFHATNPPDL